MADRAQDPRTAPPIRWGILGAGNIAGAFADAVTQHTRAQLVAAGETQSPRLTWDDTLAVMETMDEVRRQVGVTYPGE